MRARVVDGLAPEPPPVRRRSTDDAVPVLVMRHKASHGTVGPSLPRGEVRGVLALQRAVGNRAVGELMCRRELRAAAVQRDEDAPSVAAPLRRGVRLLPGQLWLAEPGDFLRDKPSLAPQGGLPLLPPAGVEGLINWGDIGSAYQERRLVLEDRDRAVIVGHWQRWYPVAQALYKLPLAPSLFNSPAAIMNTMSAKMIDSSLAGDRPNIVEQFNQRAEQFGVKTTTLSVTVGHF